MKKAYKNRLRRFFPGALAATCSIALGGMTMISQGAGLLKSVEGNMDGPFIRNHQIDVLINNGFARTEVDQMFGNNADRDFEAIYSFPLPKQASLSEVSLWIDGQEVVGEVLEKARARKIYEEQVAKGNDTALAEKDGYRTFEINVGRVRAGQDTRVRFVYYQPLEIDMNIGRYVYPLEEGGVDEERIAFWSVDDRVLGGFTFDLELKSVFPVKDVRVPGYDGHAEVLRNSDSGDADVVAEDASIQNRIHVKLHSEPGASLSRDIVVYYRLDDSIPARVELVPYRESPEEMGTFMVVVTPAADLQRIEEGTDWTFVLDTSGSMRGNKIATLADGVNRVIGKMSSQDRYRIVTFSSRATDFTGGYVQATPENIEATIHQVRNIQAGGSTALFAGLSLAYQDLDEDRTTGILLVTDGVANVGPTAHQAFLRLLRSYDIRLFTFVIGNSANQPLLDRLSRDSGGFALNISNSDDIVGRLIQAKAKVSHTCMHDVELKIRGERVRDVTPAYMGNVYLGQQLVAFGRYTGSGDVTVELTAKISGQERTWRCPATLPKIDPDNPEIERMWALSSIEDHMERIREVGEDEDVRSEVVELGTEYSLVTDYTSMVVVNEQVFEEESIQRTNAQRVDRERTAQHRRSSAPTKSYVVDQSTNRSGTFQGRRSPGIGSGPVGPLFVGILALWSHRRKR